MKVQTRGIMPVAALLVTAILAACGGPDDPGLMDRILDRTPQPDSLPVMLNAEPPFRYPQDLYSQKVQGNVSLSIFIDTAGKVINDSTAIMESSGIPALDTAALVGSRELTFVPAKRKGRAMAVRIMYPVHFRHPEAPPLPGDPLKRKGIGGGE